MGIASLMVGAAVAVVVIAYLVHPFRVVIKRKTPDPYHHNIPIESWVRQLKNPQAPFKDKGWGGAETVNFCPRCGREVAAEHRFCPGCGVQLPGRE
ncbi:MAG TPA: zinc-ribbon domain-containing protein [Chloroflexi bacterium]|nr:zinc-ribbon domain-containing protein [Chloroflexota bacterium]